jgi:hypothetical protein
MVSWAVHTHCVRRVSGSVRLSIFLFLFLFFAYVHFCKSRGECCGALTCCWQQHGMYFCVDVL